MGGGVVMAGQIFPDGHEEGVPFFNSYQDRWIIEVRPNEYAFSDSPEGLAAAQKEAIVRANGASTYYQGQNVSIFGAGGLNEILSKQGLTTEQMMKARDAANGGVMAYDPTKSEWDASTAAAIAQVAKQNASTGISPQVTANVTKAVNAVSLPSGTVTKTTATQTGETTTGTQYDPLTVILGAVLFVLLIVMLAGSSIGRAVRHGV